MMWTLPDSTRSETIDADTRRYRLNVSASPDPAAIQNAIEELQIQTKRAAVQTPLGLPPEIELLIVYDSDAETGEIVARTTDYDLLGDAADLTTAFPAAVTDNDSPIRDALARVAPEETITGDGKLDGSAFADALVDPRTGAEPILLTFEDALDGMRSEDTPTPRWDDHFSTVQDIDKHGIPEMAVPDGLPLTHLLSGINQLDSDVVCQLHVGFGYDVGETPVYSSRRYQLQKTPLDPDEIQVTPRVTFTFRLFAFNHTTSDKRARDGCKALARHLRPWVQPAASPAIYQAVPTGVAVFERRDYIRKQFNSLLRGDGHAQITSSLSAFTYLAETIAPWLTLPALGDALDAGFGPPPERSPLVQARSATRDTLLDAEAFALGRDPATDRSLALPAWPQRHALFADDPARRRARLSTRITAAHQSRDHPVFVLDVTGELADTYLRRAATTDHSAQLDDHAIVNVADTHLPVTPLQSATSRSLGTPDIDTRVNLYSTLCTSYIHSEGYTTSVPGLRGLVESVLRSTEASALPHAALVDEATAHLPQPTPSPPSSAVEEAKHRHDFLSTVQAAVPDCLLGEYQHDTDLWAVAPTDGVLWFDFGDIETALGRRMAATIVLDAIQRHAPTRTPSDDPAATVVLDHAEQVTIPHTVETAVTDSSSADADALVDPNPPLALIAGFDISSNADVLRGHGAICDPEEGATVTLTTQSQDAQTIALPETLREYTDHRTRQCDTNHALVALPQQFLDDAADTTVFSPVSPPVATATAQPDVDPIRARLAERGAQRTPASPGSRRTPDIDRTALHATRLTTSTSESEPSENQVALSTFGDAARHWACATCHARYDTVDDARACHAPDHPHHNRLDTTGSQQPDTALSVPVPDAFRDRLTFDHEDTLTQFFRDAMHGHAPVSDLEAVVARLREGLASRIDGDTYGNIPLEALVFIQSVEAKRIALCSPLAQASTRDLRRSCFNDSPHTVDEFTKYVEANKDSRKRRYYSVTDHGAALDPITTFSTPADTPNTPVAFRVLKPA